MVAETGIAVRWLPSMSPTTRAIARHHNGVAALRPRSVRGRTEVKPASQVCRSLGASPDLRTHGWVSAFSGWFCVRADLYSAAGVSSVRTAGSRPARRRQGLRSGLACCRR